MVAHQWLVEAVGAADQNWRLRQQPDSPQNVAEEGEASSSECSDTSSCSDMSSSTDELDLANYGPTLEEHQAHVAMGLAHLGSTSTKEQYERKYQEYKEFAKVVFKDEEITVERTLKFLQFQAHREMRVAKQTPDEAVEKAGKKRKYKSKRMKKSDKTKAAKYVFKKQDYIKVMDHIRKNVVGVEPENWVTKNRLNSIEKYRQALLRFASDEVKTAIRACSAITTLVDNVNRRTKMAKVEFDDDCLNKITEKFKYPELYKLTEGFLWDENKTTSNWKSLATSFRNRKTFLESVQTCTRHEATLSSMLQAYEIVRKKLDDELEEYSILVRNIYKGKTNQNDSATVLQAKSIRHLDPKFCEQGALAIYLFARFRVHDEEFDLSNNSNWLKVRTTVALNNNKKQFEKSRFQPMSQSTYYDKLAIIFQHFGYHVTHVVHFGRSCAPVLLEFAEVMTVLIEQLGNWQHTTYNKSYSLNLPWDALRAAAGGRKEKGFYRLPRNQLEVPVALKRFVFPNVERARQKFEQLSKERRYCLPMATKFLSVMDHLAGVFVQDICQMRFQGRDTHQLYTDPFFQNPLFQDYERRFREVFVFHSDPRNDPTIDPIRRAAPLMGHHLGDLKGITYQGFESLNRQVGNLHQQNESLCAAMNYQVQLSQHMYKVIGSAVNAAHAAHTHSILPPLPNITPKASPTAPPNCNKVTPPKRQEANVNVTAASAYPEFDRLCYEAIEQIHDDWFGEGTSAYVSHGGIKSLYDNKEWRKSLGSNASKREADKKMLQKMKRIGDYMENRMNDGETKDQVTHHMRTLLQASPKSKETLTGIDKLLKDEAEKEPTGSSQ